MNTRHAERRLHPRRPHRTPVVFEDEFGDGLFFVFSEDVSIGGLRLASDIPLRVGTLLFLSFALPGHKRPIRVTGEVVRRPETPAGGGGSARLASGPEARPPGTPSAEPWRTGVAGGMGIRFVGLSEMARKRLEAFLGDEG